MLLGAAVRRPLLSMRNTRRRIQFSFGPDIAHPSSNTNSTTGSTFHEQPAPRLPQCLGHAVALVSSCSSSTSHLHLQDVRRCLLDRCNHSTTTANPHSRSPSAQSTQTSSPLQGSLCQQSRRWRHSDQSLRRPTTLQAREEHLAHARRAANPAQASCSSSTLADTMARHRAYHAAYDAATSASEWYRSSQFDLQNERDP